MATDYRISRGGFTDRPLNSDTDGDGISDGVEDRNRNGRIDRHESDPTSRDSDNDGLPDGLEDRNHNGERDLDETDATRADTDNDGIKDGIIG